MKRVLLLMICFFMFPWGDSSLFGQAIAREKGTAAPISKLKKSFKDTGTSNLINDPTFSKFNQEEENSWVYAINGGKNSAYKHMPLVPTSQRTGYDIPDGAGGPIVGHVEQTDFNGEKGITITNKATPQNANHQTKLGQYLTGLEVGKTYTFSLDIKTSVASEYVSLLKTKKEAGNINPEMNSMRYPTKDSNWTHLNANQWKTLTYTFVAKETTLWYQLSFQETSVGRVISIKKPQVKQASSFQKASAGRMISTKKPPIKQAPSFANSPYGTLIDAQGNYVSGKPIVKKENIIYLHYFGSNVLNDSTIDGNKVSLTEPSIPQNSVLRIQNAGEYNGEPVVLAIKALSDYVKVNLSKVPIEFKTTQTTEMNLEIWIENTNGQEIKDDKVSAILAQKVVYINQTAGRYIELDFLSKNNIENIAALNTSINDNITLNLNGDSYTQTLRPISNPLYNIIYNTSEHFYYSQRWKNDDGSLIEGGNLDGIHFLDNDLTILVPIAYMPPSLQKTQNEGTFQAKLSLIQTVPKQNDSFYADPLTLTIDAGALIKTKAQLQSLKIVDKNQQDRTKDVRVSSETEGKITLEIPKTLLQQLQENQLFITGDFDLNTDSPQLLETYQQDGYFHIPVEAKNNQEEEIAKTEMLVKMPPPEGAAKADQTVVLHSSTTDLNPANLVENLHSVLPNDEIEVVGFKNEVTFDTVGKSEVTVLIRSKLTGVEGSITVPIEVIGVLVFKKVPETLSFKQSEISPTTKLIPREDANWAIEIDNSIATNWQVTAQSTPVKDEQGKTYPNAIVFKDANGRVSDLAAGKQVVATGDNNNSSPSVSWAENQGVLFQQDPARMQAGTYSATITWTLEDTP